VKQVHNSILKHAPTLKKLCLGFQDVVVRGETKSIMDLILRIPNLEILHLYLGFVTIKSLPPLRSLAQLKRLVHLEIGAFFNRQAGGEIAKEFIEICKNLQALRYLTLKPVWTDSVGTSDFHHIFMESRKMFGKKLKSILFNFINETWLLNKPDPKPKQSALLLKGQDYYVPKKSYYNYHGL